MLIPCQHCGLDVTFGMDNFHFQVMLKHVVYSLGLEGRTDKNSRRKNKVKTSSHYGMRSKDLYVKIVHQGGQQEVYHHAFPASKLMAKYPGMCVARAQIFMAPHQPVLRPEDHLLLGHKYVIMSCRDVEKLKHKIHQQGKTKEHNGVVTLEANITRSTNEQKPKENDKKKLSVPNGVPGTDISPNACKINKNCKVKEAKGLGEEKMNVEMNVSQGERDVEEVHYTAKDFYDAKDKSERYSRRKGIKVNKPFSPPLPKGRSYRGLGWQPSLATVQELSY